MNDRPTAVATAGLARVLEDNRGELLRFLGARTGSAADAEDLLHDLWLKVGAMRPGPVASPRSYLFRMANNLVIDRARERTRAMRRDRAWADRDGTAAADADRPDPAPTADDLMLAAEEQAVIHAAIASLPDGARRALLAFRFEGLGQSEIAARMGISRSGVEKHLALAMKRLREHLGGCGYFPAAPSVAQGETGNGDD